METKCAKISKKTCSSGYRQNGATVAVNVVDPVRHDVRPGTTTAVSFPRQPVGRWRYGNYFYKKIFLILHAFRFAKVF